MAKCDICKKELSLLEGYTDNKKRYCEKCWKKKEGIPFEDLEKKYKKNPELKRLDQLKSSRSGAVITIVLSILLIGYSILNGMFNEGFFIISFEFLLGLIFLIIGSVRIYSIDERIKDLEMMINKKKIEKKKK